MEYVIKYTVISSALCALSDRREGPLCLFLLPESDG